MKDDNHVILNSIFIRINNVRPINLLITVGNGRNYGVQVHAC